MPSLSLSYFLNGDQFTGELGQTIARGHSLGVATAHNSTPYSLEAPAQPNQANTPMLKPAQPTAFTGFMRYFLVMLSSTTKPVSSKAAKPAGSPTCTTTKASAPSKASTGQRNIGPTKLRWALTSRPGFKATSAGCYVVFLRRPQI